MHNKELNVHYLVNLKEAINSLVDQLFEEDGDIPEHANIMKKEAFLKKIDDYIIEFEGQEKFFKSMKE